MTRVLEIERLILMGSAKAPGTENSIADSNDMTSFGATLKKVHSSVGVQGKRWCEQ